MSLLPAALVYFGTREIPANHQPDVPPLAAGVLSG